MIFFDYFYLFACPLSVFHLFPSFFSWEKGVGGNYTRFTTNQAKSFFCLFDNLALAWPFRSGAVAAAADDGSVASFSCPFLVACHRAFGTILPAQLHRIVPKLAALLLSQGLSAHSSTATERVYAKAFLCVFYTPLAAPRPVAQFPPVLSGLACLDQIVAYLVAPSVCLLASQPTRQ